MCYKRLCKCKGCFYENYFEFGNCQMRKSVKELVKKFGKPTEVDLKRFGEWEQDNEEQ